MYRGVSDWSDEWPIDEAARRAQLLGRRTSELLCSAVAEFMIALVQPPQPLAGRVTSTIQCGARSGPADAKNVLQSVRLRGDHILVPKGQLFLSFDLRTSKPLVHLTRPPAE